MVLFGECIKESFSKRNVILSWSWFVQLKYTLIVATGTGFWGCGKLNSTMNLDSWVDTWLSWVWYQSTRCDTDIFWSRFQL